MAFGPLGFSVSGFEKSPAFHAAALNAGGVGNGAPGLRPQYHANCHGAFARDPDGHNIDAVCRTPEP